MFSAKDNKVIEANLNKQTNKPERTNSQIKRCHFQSNVTFQN